MITKVNSFKSNVNLKEFLNLYGMSQKNSWHLKPILWGRIYKYCLVRCTGSPGSTMGLCHSRVDRMCFRGIYPYRRMKTSLKILRLQAKEDWFALTSTSNISSVPAHIQLNHLHYHYYNQLGSVRPSGYIAIKNHCFGTCLSNGFSQSEHDIFLIHLKQKTFNFNIFLLHLFGSKNFV